MRWCDVGVFFSPGGGVLSRGTVIIGGVSGFGVDGREDCGVVAAGCERSSSVGMVDGGIGLVGEIWEREVVGCYDERKFILRVPK